MVPNLFYFVRQKIRGKQCGEDEAWAAIPITLQQNLDDIRGKGLYAHKRDHALAIA